MDNFDNRNSCDEFASLFNFQGNDKAIDFTMDQVEIVNVDSDFRWLTSDSMNFLKITKAKRKWHEVILWWEIRRIPYNVIMYFVGLLSFQIAYVTIPLVYLVIGFVLNVIYTFGWIIELLFINRLNDRNRRMKYPPYTFLSYLTFSALFVLGIAIFLIVR